MLFLANIQPDLQREVREQCADARFVALDSMNLWIDIARDSLLRTIATVDCLILNDAELKQLTDEPNLVRAARAVLDARARAWSSPSRASTARRCSRARASSALPAYPLETSSTRPAPATRSPAASSATSPRTPSEELADELLRRAMAYGTALASFNVEEFGTERVQRSTRDEIAERVARAAAHHALRRTRRSRCAPDAARCADARPGVASAPWAGRCSTCSCS